ncbi:MAG: hypothetical protein AVO39_06475 [delta proteobacterium MLS_D]|nr:MAG: hypothetical protein AVO39_06475 [delta proteobacterium MLS_D]
MRIDDETLETIRSRLKTELTDSAEILLFTTDRMTGSCDNRGYNDFADQLLDAIADVDRRLSVRRLDLFGDEGRAFGLSLSPTLLIGAQERFPVQFHGAPTGNLGGAFIEAILMISRRDPDLTPESRRLLGTIARPVTVECFVAPDCAYCPAAVDLGARIAFSSGDVITFRSIDITQGMDRALLFDVASVPHLVIGEDPSTALVGVPREEALVGALLGR